jgi:hypothetical protein
VRVLCHECHNFSTFFTGKFILKCKWILSFQFFLYFRIKNVFGFLVIKWYSWVRGFSLLRWWRFRAASLMLQQFSPTAVGSLQIVSERLNNGEQNHSHYPKRSLSTLWIKIQCDVYSHSLNLYSTLKQDAEHGYYFRMFSTVCNLQASNSKKSSESC